MYISRWKSHLQKAFNDIKDKVAHILYIHCLFFLSIRKGSFFLSIKSWSFEDSFAVFLSRGRICLGYTQSHSSIRDSYECGLGSVFFSMQMTKLIISCKLAKSAWIGQKICVKFLVTRFGFWVFNLLKHFFLKTRTRLFTFLGLFPVV